MENGYKVILKQKEYCKLMLAEVINRFGDSIDAIALTWLIYQISGNPALSAINFGMNYLPTIILQPLAGAFIENKSKKNIMIICDLIRGVIVSVIAVLFYYQILKPWQLILGTMLLSTSESFRMPAGKAITPLLLKKEDYAFGLSFNSTMQSIVEIIGTALASVIIGVLGIFIAIMIDAITFFISAVILMFIKVNEKDVMTSKLKYLDQLKEGFQYLKSSKALQVLCFLSCLLNALLVPINSFQSVLVVEVYHMSAVVLSVFGISLSIGMSIGSFVFPYLDQRIKSNLLILTCLVIQGLFYIGLILISHLTYNVMFFYFILTALTFIFGMFVSFTSASLSILKMRLIKQSYMARLSGILTAFATLCLPVTSFVLSILIKMMSVSQLFIVFGVLCIIVTIFITKSKILDYI